MVHNKDLAEEFAQFSGADTPIRVLLLGDSHTKDLFNALYQNAELFPQVEFRFDFFEDGCMLPHPPDTEGFTRACIQAMAKQQAPLFDQATHVLFSMYWAEYGIDQLDTILDRTWVA